MNWNKIPVTLHNPAKVPLQPNGHSANTHDPTTWSSYQEVREVNQKREITHQFLGTNFVLTRAEYEPAIEIKTNLKISRMGPAGSLHPIDLVSTQQRLVKTVAHYGCGN